MRIHLARLIICLLFFALSTTLAIGQFDEVSMKISDAPGKRIFTPRELKEGESYKVYRIEMREAIDTALAFHVHRAVEEIKKFDPDVVILDINTPGGSLASTQQIRDDLLNIEVPIYAFINESAWSAGALLAVTADTIIMHPLSSIGASQVIMGTGAEISEVVEQKINSALKAQIRGSARHKGHPIIICEAFIDRKIGIPGLSPKGEVLTLDATQATTETLYIDSKTSETVVLPALAAFIAKDDTDLLKKAGIWPAITETYGLTWNNVSIKIADAPGKRIFTPRELKEGESYKVYRIEMREAIDTALAFHVHRAVEEIKKFDPDVVILDINTPGGSLASTQQIRDDLLNIEVPIYAFINESAWSAGALLAVTADTIIMHPLSSIGASQVIMGTGAEISEVVEQKINSALKAQIRGSARHKGHPLIICEAFIDRKIEIPGLSPEGEVLTLDATQATRETIYIDTKTSETVILPALADFVAENETDLLKKAGIWPAITETYELTWSEKFAKYLLLIKPFLLLIGIGCLYYEMKAPGVGALGVIGVLALAAFFWGSMLAGLADHIEVVLFIAGVLFLAVEIFIIPGFGVAGVTGVGLMVASIIMAMVKFAPPPQIPELDPNYEMLHDAMMSFIYAFALLIPTLWIMSKLLPNMPLFGRLILDPAGRDKRRDPLPPNVNTGLPKPPKAQDIIGKTGKALTDLRPAGTAIIDGNRLDVITEGDYINKDEQVIIIACDGNVHIVEKAVDDETESETE